jgi:hypothetical protein
VLTAWIASENQQCAEQRRGSTELDHAAEYAAARRVKQLSILSSFQASGRTPGAAALPFWRASSPTSI